MNKILRLGVVLFSGLGLVGLFMLALPTSAARDASPEANIVVDTLEDVPSSFGNCSLREAITAANDNTPVDACPAGHGALTDTITFSMVGTITLTEQLSITAGGPLVIDGSDVITVSGNGSVRILWVEPDSELTLRSIHLYNGWVSSYYDERGGGIYNNAGVVTLLNISISSSVADSGGGIYNNENSQMSIINSSIINNYAWKHDGGGVLNRGKLSISDSTISYNGAYWHGGGINNYQGAITITECTISDNNITMGYGGGVRNQYGKVSFTNSTLSNNSARFGGGLNNEGKSTFLNSTIANNNSSQEGGGINNEGEFIDDYLVVITNTIITNNSDENCYGYIYDGGHNIDSEDTCGLDPANGSMLNTDPLIEPLRNNGGPTWTHALLPNSPAIDAADPANCPPTDQRGVSRPIDGNGDKEAICDIGSFEFPLRLFLPLIKND